MRGGTWPERRRSTACASARLSRTTSSQSGSVERKLAFRATPDQTVGGTMSSREPCSSRAGTRPPRSTVWDRAAAAELATTAAALSEPRAPGLAKARAAMPPWLWPKR